MEPNITDLNSNITLMQVTNFFNISFKKLENESEVDQMHLFDLYEAYKTREREQLAVYKFVSFVVGSLIVICNLTVVISSGLIIKKGQQPKTTYLLLGNVSLADTIIGMSIIFAASLNTESYTDSPLCIFQIGIMVCPAIVSIFSVGFIAIDRYIYILHGLYYQRWFSTTKVRIGIVCIWCIGLTLGFLPATGWINTEADSTVCVYISLFPGPLIMVNSILSLLPIALVCILYPIILFRALKNLQKIKKSKDYTNTNLRSSNQLRIFRGNLKNNEISSLSIKYPKKNNNGELVRSASCSTIDAIKLSLKSNFKCPLSKWKSNHNITNDEANKNDACFTNGSITKEKNLSTFSISTVETSLSDQNVSSSDITGDKLPKCTNKFTKHICMRKTKDANKWRAIIVVMLTFGSFAVTWMPFFITVTAYVLCEEKFTNPKCLQMRSWLAGPLATLAFLNSVLNPMIYAWWHKGFKKSAVEYFHKYVRKYFIKKS